MGRQIRFAALLSGVSFMAMASAAQAQDIQLDGIIVTFSKVAESAIDALGGSSAIGKEQLDEQFQPERLSDVLRTIPGVTTQDNGRDTAQAVNIRGLQDFGRVNVLVEGARQNFQRSGHAANGAFYLDPEMVKSIDVTRGPTATIYGSGAIGGVVAFGLLDADDILREGEYAAGRSKFSYGSNGDGRVASQTLAMKVGNFDIVGQLNGHWNDNYEDGGGKEIADSENETKSQFAKARWRPAQGHEITATVVNLDSEFVDRVESPVLIQRDSELNNRQYTLGYTFVSPDNPLIDFSAKVYRNTTDLDQIRRSNNATRFFNVETDGVDVFNTSRFNFGSTKLALTYGGDAFRDSVKTLDIQSNGDEFTPSGEREVAGTFVQSQLTFFDMVDLITAVRYDTYKMSGDGLDSDGDHVSPKVTLGVTPIKGLTVFGTYAEGFRAPALSETLPSGTHPGFPFQILPNTDLSPEVAHNLEAGVNLKYNDVASTGDAFRAKVVAFRNKVDDYIGPDDQSFGMGGTCTVGGFNFPCGTYQYVNFGKVKLEGVEAEVNYDARSWFAIVGASRIRGTDEETGNPLLSVPADQITATLGFRALDNKLVAGVRARFVAEQDRVPPSSVVVPSDSYTIVDLFAQYQITDNALINFNVDNVFDTEYRQYLDLLNDPGLNARVGLTMRLGAN